ncbi:hypothetical protein ACI3LY_000941 [Candidozyma auris]|uniref:RNase III domain-containing protein n=2 Tax=Candidozyma auris TaxID=498019 RepID=A0AB36WCA5_CANAR|nr:hypothetical protein QG37_07756 [[Candida] auris]PIS57092.1 hypothetical protein CJI97_000115 [[Candida] auris]PIS58664.1 hypothetical protein B9J08_000110 [[Candida] auris]QWW23000.1 hypothetical protein CA7LBN_001801 [[Candida] auris]
MAIRLPQSLIRQRRLNHFSAVSSKDLFLKSRGPVNLLGEKANGNDCHHYLRSITNFDSIYIDGAESHRNSDLEENLHYDVELKESLEARTAHVQRFLNPYFSLAFKDLLLITCGLANFKIQQHSKPAGPVFDKGYIHQNVLREWGKRYFDLNLKKAAIFPSLSHLSMSHSEIDHHLSYFTDMNAIISEFMGRQLLYECLIPCRGAQVDGKLSREEADQLRASIRDKTAIGSFYTMFGVLLFRYGKGEATQDFLQRKILDGKNGIYGIATSNFS